MKVEGVAEIQRKFANLSGRAQRAVVRDSLRSAARVVEKAARQRVPVDTGRLKKAITQRVTVQSSIGEALVGYRKEAFYGGFVELGTSKMAAQPFLRPALDENTDEIEKTFVNALNRTIEARSG
ncbi:MAG: HK97 gp10 family phage protein [Acidobacteriota bacterium]|nr:HK97 gp10 family phage protein [Acidobacteriota bacterium]